MIRPGPLFADRREAGRQLAVALAHLDLPDPVVLALPRGGVPVGFEVAEVMNAPLDLVFVRKIGAPNHPELGCGAVVDGADPQVVLNQDVVDQLAVPDAWLKAQTERELQEIARRRELYAKGRPPEPLKGRTAVVVDDGVATGGTAIAALRGLKKTGAAKVVLAVPVAPPQVLDRLRRHADEVAYLAAPDPFYAVGLFYENFAQTSDEEVVDLLERARDRQGSSGPGGPHAAPPP
jgi:putative phosphoribosyl transferase